MYITLVLIPLVLLKLNPAIRALQEQITGAEDQAEKLLALAHRQMQPLNALFSDRDSLILMETTLPQLHFDPCFTIRQETDMRINYDFPERESDQQTTLDLLSGNYNENPFLFENKLIHTMGTETYHGYKTIHWTETYRDSNGKLQTRHRSETLHATVTKPKPFYNTQVVLNYCAQGGPELSFSRDATYLDRKNDRQLERYVKRGERKLKRMTDKSIQGNGNFMSMSNGDFEVLFDALNRTNEVQFRTLFTPLAQTNMVELIRSKIGYGDDFHFIKAKRTNQIISGHSQGRPISLPVSSYISYDFDEIQRNFINKNTEFFRAVYFDFAPVWSIPIYQERPVHSLKPIPNLSQLYSLKESEALANAVPTQYVVHPDTKTPAILLTHHVASSGQVDETSVTALSYDIAQRVDIVPVYGGDGRYHNVAVQWDEYLPLEITNHFYVASADVAQGKNIYASKNGLCIFSP